MQITIIPSKTYQYNNLLLVQIRLFNHSEKVVKIISIHIVAYNHKKQQLNIPHKQNTTQISIAPQKNFYITFFFTLKNISFFKVITLTPEGTQIDFFPAIPSPFPLPASLFFSLFNQTDYK